MVEQQFSASCDSAHLLFKYTLTQCVCVFFLLTCSAASADSLPVVALTWSVGILCVWLQIQLQPRVLVLCVSGFRSRSKPVQTPKPSNSDVSPLLPLPPSFHSIPFFSLFHLTSFLFFLSCPSTLPHTSSPHLHPLFAPLCPTAVSVAGAVDSVVVSALRHNLRLLGGAGSPLALQGRHSVSAHYRHNLLLSPVSKPWKPLPRITPR